jgi:hypothetical protein
MCWRQLTVKTYTKALHERSVYDLNTAVADRILNRVFIRAAAFKRGFRLALTPSTISDNGFDRLRCFCKRWRKIAVVAMATVKIVILHIGSDVVLAFFIIFIAAPRHPLCLETSKKSFHRGVIPTISFATHALFNAVSPEALPKGFACVVAPLVRVKHYAAGMTPGFKSHH